MTAPAITPSVITKSYRLLELLTVLEHASTNIEHVGGGENDAANMGRSIGLTLGLALELASDLHDVLEKNAARSEA
jgi:hypothetical protein